MKKILTEIEVYSHDSIFTVWQSGAEKVKLCSDIQAGSITLSSEAIETARKQLHVTLHAIIYNLGGEFEEPKNLLIQ